MISLTCTNCRTKLNIDDAFAGGVCRCKHCGTIQTVPSRLKGNASRAETSGAAASASKPQKALFQHARASASSHDSGIRVGTGLDELAEVVASSGLSGSGLTSARLRRSSEKTSATASPRSLTPYLAAAGIVIVVLLGLVLWLSLRRPVAAKASAQSIDSATADATAVAVVPNFCAIKLDAPVVIYVLDRGNGTRELFDTLKEVTYKSIESLGGDRKFQVIFWHNGQQEDAFPNGLPAYSTKENLAACRRATEDVIAFGQSDATDAIKKAVANRAEVIVLVTGKSLELDDAFAQNLMAIRSASPVKIHTIALGESESPVLREIAHRTGGEYKTVTAAMLRTFAD